MILSGWDGKTARFDSVSQLTKTKPDTVRSMVEDAQGQIWLGPKLNQARCYLGPHKDYYWLTPAK